MINLTLIVDNITDILHIFSTIQIRRYTGIGTPSSIIDESQYTTVEGIDEINDRTGVSDVLLSSPYTQYYFIDPIGVSTDWYISRYYNPDLDSASGWAEPVQTGTGDLYFNPLYPPEMNYSAADQRVINRIRLLVGDPIGLNREYGTEAESSIHPDGRVYEFDEYGWPCSVAMYNTQYISKANPSINGYKYLRFNEAIDTTPTTISGVEYSVDIWYYTFRNSDRQIMEAYDNCPPPPPLSAVNCTSEIFMLSTAYDLLSSESWENINEDGAKIGDEGSSYDPSAGLRSRDDMLTKLKDRLEAAIKANRLLGISGVRID